MECKRKLIEIFNVMSDLRADYRLALMLKMLEDQVPCVIRVRVCV